MKAKTRKCRKCGRILDIKRFYYNWKFRDVCRDCSGHLERMAGHEDKKRTS